MKVYKNKKAETRIRETYDHLLEIWEVDKEEIDLSTYYGTTHVIQCGSMNNPPLVLFHGVGDDSALMWALNAKALAQNFCLYAIDTIGGPGKSVPNENYNRSFDQVKWLDEVLSKLAITQVFMAGVSNGAYLTQLYGIRRPQKVKKLICMSGAVSTIDSANPMKKMLQVFLPEALFPTRKNAERLIKKLCGINSDVFIENETFMDHYLVLLKGFNNMSMGYHKIEYFTEEELLSIKDKVLFLLGEEDPLGNKEVEIEKLEHYHMNYRFFKEVGHAINHEISEEVNTIITSFFLEKI